MLLSDKIKFFKSDNKSQDNNSNLSCVTLSVPGSDHAVNHASSSPYQNVPNSIKTTKYTIYNFLIKNLYEQITTRWANIYFILIAILNCLPWAKVQSPIVAMMPICGIMLVTLIKDLFEDFQRLRSDKLISRKVTEMYNFQKREFEENCWQDILPGKIIRVTCGEQIPADCLILASSEEGQICYLSTSNLDGESNLKHFQAVGLKLEDCHKIESVKINRPTPELYNIIGQVVLPKITLDFATG